METHVAVFRDCAVRVLHRMADLAARPGPVAPVFARDVAWRVAGEALGADGAPTVHAIAMEMVNTVAGNATGLLLRSGLCEGLTPPTIVEGPQVFFGFVGGIETIAVPLHTEEGSLALLVSLKRGREPGPEAGALSA